MNNDASPGDILVVDDTVANLKLLVNILSEAGYQVRPAGDGELALRSVQAREPALILLDIKMPGVDGFEVCRRLKADERTREIPVIFLSSLTDTADRTKGFELGAVDYIDKPYHAQEVLARIRTHLALSGAKQQLNSQNLQLQRANEQLTGEIAERKRAEEALRQSRDRLEDLYRSVGEGIISVDADQRIVLFNTAAERIFGYSAAAAIGQPLSMLLPERFRLPHDKHIREFEASGQSNRTMGTYGLIYGLRASGREFPIEATVSQSGALPGKQLTVILRDITERRRAEQERERLTKQLELLSARLSETQEGERRRIGYELHEELGQELAALKLYLGMIGPGSGGAGSSPPLEEALAVATHATEHVRKLVKDLEPRELEDFGLNAAVRIFCEAPAAVCGWDLEIDAPEPDRRAPRPVERACFRVLQEGVNNVARHAKASEVRVELHYGVDRLELVIRDDGIGFDPNAQRKDDARGAKSLGLLEIQMRAKQVGGSVEIDSAQGEGTVIRAVFPLSVTSDGLV